MPNFHNTYKTRFSTEVMSKSDWKGLASELSSLLNLQSPPIAITFSDTAPPEVPRYEGTMPDPTVDGRTGKVPAGCVFWMKASNQTFTTVPEDHGNCSVGSYTHGLKTAEKLQVILMFLLYLNADG